MYYIIYHVLKVYLDDNIIAVSNKTNNIVKHKNRPYHYNLYDPSESLYSKQKRVGSISFKVLGAK